MSKIISIKKNYSYYLFYQILGLITPIVTAPYVSRIFGVSGIGVQSYTNSVVSYFILFAGMGINAYGQREIAICRNNFAKRTRLFWEIELLNVFTTGVCLAGWVVLIVCTVQYRMFYIVLSMSLVSNAFDITWFFSGLEQYKYIVLRNTIIKLAGIAMLFLFVHKAGDLLLYVGMMAAMGLLGSISIWTYLPRLAPRINLKRINIWRHFKPMIIYFIPAISVSIYTLLDKIMLGMISVNPQENGYYEQGQKIINLFQAIVLSLNTVMASRMAFLFGKKAFSEIRTRLRNSIDFIILVSIPLIIGIQVVASEFVPIFFGAAYGRVTLVLYVYAPLILFIGLSNCVGQQYLTPVGMRHQANVGIIIGAVANFALNLFLIPRFGAVGTSISSVVAEAIILIIYTYLCRKVLCLHDTLNVLYKRLIAGGIMFICMIFFKYLTRIHMLNLFLMAFVGITVYSAVLFFLKDFMFYKIVRSCLKKLCSRWRKQ